MSISPLSAISTAVGGLAASRVISGLKNGPSFFELFAKPAQAEVAPLSPAEEQMQKLQSISERIQQLLDAAGVRTSLPFQFKVETSGQVRLQSEHPQKDRIESALSGDPQLAEQLQSLTAENACLRFSHGELTAT